MANRSSTKDGRLRAVAYLRWSTRDQKLSEKAQRSAIEAWAAREGASVASWRADAGVSGSVPVDKRPGLLEALGALRGSPGAVLVIAKRDRLARSVFVAAVAERIASKNGGRIVSADGVGCEDTPEGEMLRGILDVFAQYERALIRARTRAALAAKKKAGRKIGNDAPYGWAYVDGRLVEVPAEQNGRALILRLRGEDMTYRAIVAELEAAGITPRGARWYDNTVRRICAYEPPA